MQRPSYQVFEYALNAGEQVNIHHRANSLVCLAASARFQIAFDDAPLTTFEKGLAYTTPEAFAKVRLLNDGAVTITVELGFASGGITDSRLNLPSAIETSVTNEVKTQERLPGNIADSKITVTANARATVVSRNASRREVMVTNLGEGTVYLGGGSVADGEGLPLGAGKTASLQTTGWLRAFNPTDAAVNLAIMELSR